VPRYRTFGLDIDSDLELPELCPGVGEPEPQVHIGWGSVPESLAHTKASGVLFQAAPERFLLRLDHARFLVTNGSEIRIERLAGNDPQLRVFLLGSCFGALLHQRGLLVLHASAIRTPRGAVLFAGSSGSGKSTTLGKLLQRGYPSLSDDLAAIHPNGSGRLVVEPGIPRLRLWPDSVRRLGHTPDQLQREQPGLEKCVLPTPNFAPAPVPLYRIYVLQDDPLAKQIRLEPLDPPRAFNALLRQTYRPRYLKGLDMGASHFNLASAAAVQALVVRVSRPSRPFLLEALADQLETDFLA